VAYEQDSSMFMGAFVAATSTLVFMPYAYPLAALLGSMVGADPHSMTQAADQWHDKTPVHAGPAYGPQAWKGVQSQGVSDLTYLRSELKRLSKQIGEKDWKGKAYASFTEKVDDLDDQLAKLETNRTGTGDTLNSAAQLYHGLAIFCMSVAGVMLALASYLFVARALSVPGTADAQVIKFIKDLQIAVQKVLSKHAKMTFKVSLILGAAAVAYNQFSHSLPLVQAMPGKNPKLIDASAAWDPTQSDIVDNPTAGLDPSDLGDTSPLPDIGF
jgi:hypothetical protein